MLRTTLVYLLLYASLVSTAYGAPDSQVTDTRGTEAKLVKSLQPINDNRLDVPLNEVTNLLRVNPNFKLAQLVKGDLLMARAGAIDNFGSASNAPRRKIDDFRDEARMRLRRVLSQSDTGLKPRFLWQLDNKQKYAFVVDASNATLFVYENVNGEPHYVTDFYITLGKLGTEKAVRGDKRTPIGVYFIKTELPKSKLDDFYGNGAFPLSYPNEFDRRHGRTGGGIWLHGTPSNTYSRPPRASNGCPVVANDDLDKLAPYLRAGITPIIVANQMDWGNEQDQMERATLLQEIEQWRKDWSSLDTAAYLEHYAPDFTSRNMDFPAWAKRKHLVNDMKSWIKVNISNISVFTYPEQPNMVVVNFEQDYNSSNLTNRMKKRQYWIKHNDSWKIIYEGAA